MATNKKGYFDKFKGYYVYIIKDLEDKIVYIGQTTNYYTRLANHKSRNVKTTKEFISKGNYIIQYLDVTKDIKTEQELLYLENVLIDLWEPPLNGQVNIIKDVDWLRMLELGSLLHSFGANWITYCKCLNGKIKKDKKIYLCNYSRKVIA
ncbi:hypothetical protein psyc5s11_29270 [Clostridium gelidum]|uniref:GIY-YIG domain-containing protein n=1 Tax=Clostridium gelidum TaxID=704125 RepID=A0ABM7T4G6_9CLOT|nr:GIY-YIG nuclease family protein [Clostridium gelidum]BCZ46860.1 hypothetical protein psyc5s11_29270 [Clostridium gelidum]